MTGSRASTVQIRLLQNLPVVLLVVVFGIFSLLDQRFFDPDTLVNVARQASYIGILAVGMTFVLITAGIDLSVGSIMYLTAVVVSDLLGSLSVPVFVVPLMTAGIGLLLGAVNAFGVTVLRIIPFIVTLATLTAYRGIALTQSQSREANYPSAVTDISSARVLGVPVPVLVFAVVVLVAHVVLTRTALGRQVYAVGQDRAAAERAGIPARKVLASVYVISGGLAGLAAFIAVSQLGTVAPSFGTNDEFDAIAAAVLGGTSLFGGRGNVFPGTVVGALLVQLIAVGLVFTQVDLYLTPMVSAAIIFLAVLLDTLRTKQLTRLERRSIRVEHGGEAAVESRPSAILEGDKA